MDLSVAILMSQDMANSHPPPKANPSIIAIVGFSIFQTASQQLSENISNISSDFLPLNSEISAPATKEFGLLLFPSRGLFGGAPAKIATLIESSDITLEDAPLIASTTELFNAFNLSGRLIVNITTLPLFSSSSSININSSNKISCANSPPIY